MSKNILPNNMLPNQLDADWRTLLEQQFATENGRALFRFLDEQLQLGKIVYPPQSQWFNALLLTPLASVKVVILGQDPYHGQGQAHGLSFSVADCVKLPPSLKNIFKEINGAANSNIESGDLSHWARQGVLLLNTSLTVEAGMAASHARKGWEAITAACVEEVVNRREGVVFLAWGRHAHKVCEIVDEKRHCLIKTSHPSPLGAYKNGKDFTAFHGSGCFQQTNNYLLEQAKVQIKWLL